jgi:hypothetical protein
MEMTADEEVPEDIQFEEEDKDDDEDDIYDRDFAQSMPAHHIAVNQSYGGVGGHQRAQKYNNPGVIQLTQSINMNKFVKQPSKQSDILMRPERDDTLAKKQRK